MCFGNNNNGCEWILWIIVIVVILNCLCGNNGGNDCGCGC